MRRVGLWVFLLSILASPALAEQRRFGDWFATCSNLRNCVLIGVPDFGDDGSHGYVRMSRGAAGSARSQIILVVQGGDDAAANGPWTLLVDHAAVPGLTGPSHGRRPAAETGEEGSDDLRSTLTPAQSALLIEAMRNGQTLTVQGRGGAGLAVVPLTGLSAALLWIDAAQHRVGTATALMQPGRRPAGAVPAPPAAPVIARGALPAQTGLPRRASREVQAILSTPQQGCEDDRSATPYGVARLGRDLLLWNMPCSSGAYNELSQYVFSDAHGGHARLVLLPQPPGETPAPLEQPFNSRFDVRTGILNNDEKGRSLSDCGTYTEWLWDGRAFRLLRSRAMAECRGVRLADWALTYEARAR